MSRDPWIVSLLSSDWWQVQPEGQSSSRQMPRLDMISAISVQATGLLSHRDTTASQLGRKIPELRQAVLHRQHGLGIVDVHARLEFQRRNSRGIDVDEPERRMVGHEVAAAALAILAVAHLGLGELAEMFRALGDADVLRLPQREGVDGRGRPGAAGGAMAITHAFRRALHLDLDRAAETFALVSSHWKNSFAVGGMTSRVRKLFPAFGCQAE